MSYQPTIPQPQDLISISQSALQTNFSQLNAWALVDHVPPSPSVANSGKHTKVTLPELSPAPSTAPNEGAVYTAEGPITTTTQLYFRPENNGTPLCLTGDGTFGTSGSVELAGGLIMKWGLASVTIGNNSATITFPTAFPTACYNVQVTQANFTTTPRLVYVDTLLPASFILNCDGNAIVRNLYWVALGN